MISSQEIADRVSFMIMDLGVMDGLRKTYGHQLSQRLPPKFHAIPAGRRTARPVATVFVDITVLAGPYDDFAFRNWDGAWLQNKQYAFYVVEEDVADTEATYRTVRKAFDEIPAQMICTGLHPVGAQ